MHRDSAKAQSAMEYLMTYGWALLIIAVVLVALFSLGVFNAANITGTSCIASPGFVCKSPTLTSLGTLTFDLGQNTGSTLYNIEMACASTALTTGLPSPITAFNSISAAGAVLPASTTGNFLSAGSIITVSGLPCYSSGVALSNLHIGASFSGFIWVNYTKNSGAESPALNPWITQKAINIRISVS